MDREVKLKLILIFSVIIAFAFILAIAYIILFPPPKVVISSYEVVKYGITN
jgi:hypothetical protein